MNKATEKKEIVNAPNELNEPRWSVVSFDTCEASRLTYQEAANVLSEKEAAGVYGLCIITDVAAARLKPSS